MLKKKLLIFIGIVYILGSFLAFLYVNNKRFDIIVGFYENSQEKLVEYISFLYKSLPQEERDDANRIGQIFEENGVNGFVYKDNAVLFERNVETTNKYRNSTTREMYGDYAQTGYTKIFEDFSIIVNKESGNVISVKNNREGDILISWNSEYIDDSNYIVGIEMPVNKIKKVSNYKYFMIVENLYCIISDIVVMLLILRLRKE